MAPSGRLHQCHAPVPRGWQKSNDYHRLGQTKEFLNELSAETGIPVSGNSGLVQIRRGGNEKLEQGTWAHPHVAINLGQRASSRHSPKLRSIE